MMMHESSHRQTLGSLCRVMLQNYTRHTRQDGRKYWDLREAVDWQHQLVMDAYGERMLCPEAYASVFRILMEIYIAENRAQAEEFLDDIEPYAAAEELSGWLQSSTQNFDYLTRALRERHYRDGAEALARAHQLFLIEIGQNLIEALSRMIRKAHGAVRAVSC